MEPLDNPASNPCFGCGPGHERGLRLSFSRGEDDEGPFVAASYTPEDDEIGWPGFMHGGLHFTVLYEASYWAALTLGPAVMTARGELVFDERIVPRVGRAFEARARIVEREVPEDPEALAQARFDVRATSTGDDGRTLGRLTGIWQPASRERIERAGIELPDYLAGELAP